MPSEWPFEADMYEKRDGEWKWAGAIHSVKDGEAWITQRKQPENWKVVARVAPNPA